MPIMLKRGRVQILPKSFKADEMTTYIMSSCESNVSNTHAIQKPSRRKCNTNNKTTNKDTYAANDMMGGDPQLKNVFKHLLWK